jgi:hypothetical protein
VRSFFEKPTDLFKHSDQGMGCWKYTRLYQLLLSTSLVLSYSIYIFLIRLIWIRSFLFHFFHIVFFLGNIYIIDLPYNQFDRNESMGEPSFRKQTPRLQNPARTGYITRVFTGWHGLFRPVRFFFPVAKGKNGVCGGSVV